MRLVATAVKKNVSVDLSKMQRGSLTSSPLKAGSGSLKKELLSSIASCVPVSVYSAMAMLTISKTLRCPRKFPTHKP